MLFHCFCKLWSLRILSPDADKHANLNLICVGWQLIAKVIFNLNIRTHASHEMFHVKHNYEETTAVAATMPVGF